MNHMNYIWKEFGAEPDEGSSVNTQCVVIRGKGTTATGTMTQPKHMLAVSLRRAAVEEVEDQARALGHVGCQESPP